MTDPSALTTRRRQAIMLNPRRALDALLRSIEIADDTGVGGGELTEMRILTVEAYLRLAMPEPAVRHAVAAVAAAAMPGTCDRLVLAAAAVNADAALLAGNGTGVDACDRYLTAAHQMTGVDGRRVVVATAMRAVAVYHQHHCRTGQDLLQRLLTEGDAHGDGDPDGDPLRHMLAQGLAAMQSACHDEAATTAIGGSAPPVPGAVLHPGFDAPGDYLAHRVRAHRGAHLACGDTPEQRPAQTPP